jgi:hypothetical protein
MTVDRTSSGAGFKISEAYENVTGTASGVTFEDMVITRTRDAPIYVNVYTEGSKEAACNPPKDADRTHWLTAMHFTYRDIVATTEGTYPGCFLCSPTRPCKGVAMYNVTVSAVGLTDPAVSPPSMAYKCFNANATSALSAPVLACDGL